MVTLGKTLLLLGGFFVLAGVVVLALGRFNVTFPSKLLPGDIYVERGNFRFYFPVVTCLVLSGILTLIAYLVRHFFK